MASYDDEYNRLNALRTPGMGITLSAQHQAQIDELMREQVRLRDAENAAIARKNADWHAQNQANQATPAQVPAATAPVPAPPPAPRLPSFNPMQPNSKNFKMAPIDTIQFDESNIEIALITDLLFEDIGATELANISRSDLIDGEDVIYTPIKNLPEIRREFNPNNIVATSYTSDYFARFGLNLLARGIYEPYFNDEGDLVIEIDKVSDEEEIQVQILTNGTIDEVDNV